MANEKILVVDDDTNICELLRLYLTKEGYQVTVANDGEEGLEKFNQVKPDMVLLDVMMPKMDGLEVCRRIRKAGNTPHAAVLQCRIQLVQLRHIVILFISSCRFRKFPRCLCSHAAC